MNRRHHHTCRCNECVRRRNAHRRRGEYDAAARGQSLPTGSSLYEVERDEPITYEDEVREREQRERQQLQDLERILETALSESESDQGEREPAKSQGPGNEERYRQAQQEYLAAARQEREEEERRRKARQASREAARQHEEKERARQAIASPTENVETATREDTSAPTAPKTRSPRRRRAWKSVVALIVLALAVLITILVVGFFSVSYLRGV